MRLFRLFVVSIFSFMSSTPSAYSDELNDTGDTTFRFYFGPAFYGFGSVLGRASSGLRLFENMINTGYLYSPVISDVVNDVGPFYRIPEYNFFSNRFGLELRKMTTDYSGISIEISYSDLYSDMDIPDSYASTEQYFNRNFGYLPVTRETNNRSYIVGLWEFDVSYILRSAMAEEYDAYMRVGAGLGRGWLSAYNKGPWVETVSAVLGVGTEYQLSSKSILNFEVQLSSYRLRTQPTSRIDYTSTLINPRKGGITIARMLVGVGTNL